MIQTKKRKCWNALLTQSAVHMDEVKLPEMLIGYLVGPFGALLSSGIFTSMLQNYFTDVLKLDLAFLTGLQLFSTILIVAANLVIGQMIERTKTVAGKARPWILLSALTLSVASLLMFIVPFEGVARMVWIAIAYNLFYAVAYPIYNTANSTLIAVSTRNSEKRSALASMANMATIGVLGAGSMIFPMLVSFVLKDDVTMWFIVMLAIAIFTALTAFLQFRFTRERITEELMNSTIGNIRATVSLKKQVKAVASEKYWWMIVVFYLLYQWGGAFKNGSMVFFCKWVLDNTFFGSVDAWGASQSLLGVIGAVPMAVAAIFVVPLANKFGKRLVTLTGLIISVVGGIIAGIGNGNMIPVAIGVAIKCLGSAPAGYLILAMLADVIDHIEFKNGIRTDGLTMSIYSSLMVAATPICNSLFSSMLEMSGYDQAADVALGIAAQSAIAKNTISLGYIWIETGAYALCALLIFLWTVEKKLKVEQGATPSMRGEQGQLRVD